MWWFKKKNKKQEQEQRLTIQAPPHEHTWKDMPWFLQYEYDGGQSKAEYTVIEPYVCITCGQRKNVELESRNLTGVSYEEGMKFIENVEKKYHKYLKPRAVVEDMINNILLVKDSSRLEMLEQMMGTPHSGVGTSSRYHVSTKPADFKIKVDDKK